MWGSRAAATWITDIPGKKRHRSPAGGGRTRFFPCCCLDICFYKGLRVTHQQSITCMSHRTRLFYGAESILSHILEPTKLSVKSVNLKLKKKKSQARRLLSCRQVARRDLHTVQRVSVACSGQPPVSALHSGCANHGATESRSRPGEALQHALLFACLPNGLLSRI